jgi:hypothetical protein
MVVAEGELLGLLARSMLEPPQLGYSQVQGRRRGPLAQPTRRPQRDRQPLLGLKPRLEMLGQGDVHRIGGLAPGGGRSEPGARAGGLAAERATAT